MKSFTRLSHFLLSAVVYLYQCTLRCVHSDCTLAYHRSEASLGSTTLSDGQAFDYSCCHQHHHLTCMDDTSDGRQECVSSLSEASSSDVSVLLRTSSV